jgi:cysteine sulfinate desulfinase/cysteine desulfurase-like protein
MKSELFDCFEEIDRMCAAAGARFRTDAAQAVRKIGASAQALGADYVSFTAYKYTQI